MGVQGVRRSRTKEVWEPLNRDGWVGGTVISIETAASGEWDLPSYRFSSELSAPDGMM